MGQEQKTFWLGMVGVSLTLGLVLSLVYGAQTPQIIAMLLRRAPIILTGSADFSSLTGGFMANILISLLAMAAASLGGLVVGIGLIAKNPLIRLPCSLLMNALRNSPWLVVLYAMLYLLPFEVEVLGTTLTFSPMLKAVIGLALPVAANIAEVFRGGIDMVPSAQWEAARALGYRRLHILREIIIPQALPMMTPNIMSIYAMLFIGTSLVVVTGTNDVLSVARTVIASDGSTYATAVYLLVLLLFFLFSFPIAIFARWLEHKIRVAH